MVTPYKNIERWVTCATKFRGTVNFCQFHETYPPPDEYFNKMSFGGFHFEQYLCSYDENIPPAPNDFDVDHHEYCCVVRSQLISERESHSLFFGAELDCCVPHFKEQPGTLSNFVELKTTKVIANEYKYRNFLKHKLVK
jgi:RAT1-interacting protein